MWMCGNIIAFEDHNHNHDAGLGVSFKRQVARLSLTRSHHEADCKNPTHQDLVAGHLAPRRGKQASGGVVRGK
jgi:hypothetical protein